ERLSGRGRSGAARASARRGRRRRRRARRPLGRGRRRVRRRRRSRRGGAARMVRRPARALQGAAQRPLRRDHSAKRNGKNAEAGARRVSEVVTGVGGRALSRKGVETRQRLLDAAERVFGELGFYDASIVKITEAAGVGQGTFYLYFSSKKEIFDELVRDLNRGVRHAMKEASSRGESRLEAELLGFGAYFRFTAEHPALYRIVRQAEFVSPEMLHYHYEKLAEGYVEGLRESIARGDVGD